MAWHYCQHQALSWQVCPSCHARMQVKKQLHVAGNKLHQRRGAGAMAPSLLVQLHQKLLSASEAGLDAIEAKRRPPKL